jgi:hypothetical protein
MKRATFLLIIVLIISTISITYSKTRIGVYDSRCIAIWYFNTEEFAGKMKDLMASLKVAKEKKDTTQIKDIEEKGPLMQRIAHDKGFGRGSVAEILEKRKTELAELAKNEKISAIVSQWEVNFSSSDIELVDVTLKLLELLEAPDKIKQYYEDMKSQEPMKDAFLISPNE